MEGRNKEYILDAKNNKSPGKKYTYLKDIDI
jgi:hypothetical protein